MELIPNSCAPVGDSVVPEISRSLLYGGSAPDGQVSPVAATSFWRFRHHFITNPQSKNDSYLEMVAITNDIHQKSSSFRNLYL